jgi:hypothetical protein
MNGLTPQHIRQTTFVTELLLGITVILVLICYAVLSHPASVSHAGLLNFLASVGALLAYAGAALWVRHRSAGLVQIVLAEGARVGLGLGVIAIFDLVLEHFVASDSTVNVIRGVGMWGLMFLAFGAAGSAAYQKAGSLGLAVMSSVWAGLLSAVCMLIGGFVLAVMFMPQMVQILAPEYARSGMIDPQAFVVQHTLSASTLHLLLVPVVAAIFGLIGGCASSALRHTRRNLAVSVGIFELLIFAGGLASLRFASSLDRAARPPFVMTGLLALGITLACAHPVLTIIRRGGAAA